MKLVLKSLGETASTIQNNSYLKKGNVFEEEYLKTINPEYIDLSIQNMGVFTLKFAKIGFFALQCNILIHPFNKESISNLVFINNKTNEETTLIKVYGQKYFTKNNYFINNNNIENHYSFILKNELGKTLECRIKDIEVFSI
jgi:hypothetical protein